MNTKQFSNALGNIGETYVDEAITYKANKKSKSWKKLGAIAACIAVVLTAIVVAIPMMTDTPAIPPVISTEQPNEAGGVNGKINVLEKLTIVGQEYTISNDEAVEYLNNAKNSIKNDLKACGIPVSQFEIKETGYSHIRTGDDGNSMAVNWRDYLAYDGDRLVAIIQVTKEETGLKHFLSFGGTWFSRYEKLLQQYKGTELAYIYIGDVEAFITPNNEVVPLMDIDVSSTLEQDLQYYEYFKTQYNVYIP